MLTWSVWEDPWEQGYHCKNAFSSHSQESGDGFYVLVESLLDNIFRFGSLMSHVASHYEQPDYLTDVEEIAELSEMKEDILNRVSNAITQVLMCVWTIKKYI